MIAMTFRRRPSENRAASVRSTIHGRRACAWLAAFLGCSMCGCHTLDLSSALPWDGRTSRNPPAKIMAVWTDAIQNQPGQPSQRGFGGRVFFYNESDQTIQVEGTVVIYVFDDDRPLSESQVPETKFVFPAETLASRYSKCPLGHSYNFWIPLGPVDGATRHLSLVTRLELSKGGSVVSSITRKILPGSALKARPQTLGASRDSLDATDSLNNRPATMYPVQTAHYESAEEEPENSDPPIDPTRRNLNADTIELTPSFTQRLRAIPGETAANPPVGAGQEDRLKADPDSFRDSSPDENPPNWAADPAAERPAHSEPGISPVLTPPSSRPVGQLPRHQPHRGGWLSGLPPTPRSGFRNERKAIDLSESRLARQATEAQRVERQPSTPTSARAENSADVVAKDD